LLGVSDGVAKNASGRQRRCTLEQKIVWHGAQTGLRRNTTAGNHAPARGGDRNNGRIRNTEDPPA
jgi:hypothetical protein